MTQELDRTAGEALRPEPEAETIMQLLRRIVRLSHVQSRRMVQRYGLTVPQLMCLQALHRSGELTPTGLARAVELSPATVTGIVHRLEARGMVQRTRSQADRRSSVLALTDAARETFATLPRSLESRFAERLRELPDGEQAALTDALHSLVGLMKEAGTVGSEELLPPAEAGEHLSGAGAPELPPGLAPQDDLSLTVRPGEADPGRTTK